MAAMLVNCVIDIFMGREIGVNNNSIIKGYIKQMEFQFYSLFIKIEK